MNRRLMWTVALVVFAIGMCCVPVIAEQQSIVFGFKGTTGELQVAQQLVERFNASHPNIRVEVLDMTAGGSWVEKLAVLTAGGAMPDVIRMEYQRSIGYVLDGQVRPLDEFINRDSSFNVRAFFPVAIEAHTVNGKIYGIPQEAQPFTMFVNRSRLEELGFSFPGNDWTVNDLLGMARKATRDINQDGRVDLYGWQFDTSVTRMEPWFMAFGGRVLTEDRSKTMFDSPQLAQAMQFLYEAAVQYGVKGGSFAAGTTVFYSMGGPWMVPGFRQSISGWDWDIVPVPGGPGGRGTTLGSDAYYISSSCKTPEAAWEFVKYITSEEGLSLLAREGNVIPARNAIAVNYINTRPTQPPHNLQAYLAGIEISRPTQVFRQFTTAEQVFNRVVPQIFNNQIAPTEALNILATQINALLD